MVFKDYMNAVFQCVNALSRIINPNKSQEIYDVFIEELQISAEITRETDWSQEIWAYIYPNHIGAKNCSANANFFDLANNLDYFCNLGIGVLYILPHYQSPKRDGGYDVSNYMETDKDLGGNDGFNFFIKKAQEKKLKVIIDFIPGHVSEEHEWYKRAISGDEYYQKYFLTTDTMPSSKVVIINGETCVEYDGSYSRVLAFPDVTKTHWYYENGKYYYSSFYPFQKDLDNQNPCVIREHLKTLKFWIKQGVNGIRADAIGWWIKPKGSSGLNHPESFALCELFHIFLKLYDSSFLFFPEVVEVSENTLKYLGKSVEINGSKTGSVAGALINFQKSVQILYSFASGNFDDYIKYMRKFYEIENPQGTHDIVYSGNHHDEIYLGLLSESCRADFQKIIISAGGIVYKGGLSGGCRLADLLNNDTFRLCSFFKFFFGHYGCLAIYEGSEIGLSNNYGLSYSITVEMLKNFRDNGRIDYNHPVFSEIESKSLNPDSKLPLDSYLRQLTDGRIYHRAPLSQVQIEKANENIVYLTCQKLIRIRSSLPELSKGSKEKIINSNNAKVVCFIREYENLLLVLCNGSSSSEQVSIPKHEISRENYTMYEEHYGKFINYTNGTSAVTLTLQPFETLWISLKCL